MYVDKLLTVGVIAQKIRRPIHRVEYIIRVRGIRPIGRAGNARVFSKAAVDQIRSELHQVWAHRYALREKSRRRRRSAMPTKDVRPHHPNAQSSAWPSI
jgi:hypothetical protein